MPVLSLACHLRHNTPNIPSRYNNEQTTKQTKAINNSYIYINISCKCDTNRAGHFTLDAYASRPVACLHILATWRHMVIQEEDNEIWWSKNNQRDPFCSRANMANGHPTATIQTVIFTLSIVCTCRQSLSEYKHDIYISISSHVVL